MRAKAEHSVNHGIEALLLKQGDRKELALRFTHLTARGIEVMNVKPMLAPLVTEGRLALRYLVGVVREGVIYTAAMDIKIFAKVLSCYTGALDVPAGITYTEW